MRYLDALHKLAERSGLNWDEANEVKNVFTLEHGTDEEKAAVKAGDPAEQAKAAKQAEFDAAVAAEIQRRAVAAAAAAEVDRQNAAVQAAADAAAKQ